MMRNLYLIRSAVLLLTTCVIYKPAFPQCQSGEQPYSVTYIDSVENGFGIEYNHFTVPKFSLSGTFLEAHIKTYVKLLDYDYVMENPNSSQVSYRVGVQRFDLLSSADIPIFFDGTLVQRVGPFLLQASDGVPGSGPDYREGSMGDVWENEPVIDVIDGSGFYQGSGNITFDLETETGNPHGNPNVNTTYSRLSSVFEITYHYCDLVMLSDDLKNFSVLKTDESGYNVYWNISHEMPGHTYIVEKSRDGRNFITAGTVNGMKAEQANASYKFSGTRNTQNEFGLYFRIMKISPDGSKSYSNVKKVDWERDFYKIEVFPNPAVSEINVDLRSHSGIKEWKYQIISVDGRMVQSGNLKTPNGFTNMSLNRNITKGMYILKATPVSGGTPVTTKLFVER